MKDAHQDIDDVRRRCARFASPNFEVFHGPSCPQALLQGKVLRPKTWLLCVRELKFDYRERMLQSQKFRINNVLQSP